jgi:uncharacterized protein YaiE (UPF0345 family)
VVSLKFFLLVSLSLLLASEDALAKSKILEVPYSKQYRAFSCGHNTFRMMMGYWGQRLSRQRIIDNVGIGGSNGDNFNRYVKSKWSSDFNFSWVGNTTSALRKEIDRDHPVIVGVNAAYLDYLDYETSGGHAIILIGYDDRKKVFYLRDSNSPYVEQIGFDRLKKAMVSKKSAYKVYRKNGQFVAKRDIKHFDDAKPFGAKKTEKKGIPISWLLPKIHMTYGNEPAPNLGDGFENTEFEEGYFYHVNWNGLQYGHTTLEQTPWLGNGKAFKQLAFNMTYILDGHKFRLGSGELASPGTYAFGRHRTLDVHNFSATKQIPALSLPSFALEIDAVRKFDNEEDLVYPEHGFKVSSWGGARLALRRGISQLWGHASAGYTAMETRFTLEDSASASVVEARMPSSTFDLTFGPIKGSYQTASTENAEVIGGSEAAKLSDKLEIQAHSVGIDMKIPGLSGNLVVNALTYLGFFRMHFEYNQEILRKTVGSGTSESTDSSSRQRWDVELPVRAGFADFAYGWSVHEDHVADQKSVYHSAWLKVLYNNFLPFAQLQVGYRQTYNSEETLAQELMTGLYLGL